MVQNMRVFKDGTQLVIVVEDATKDLEEYLMGVISGQMGNVEHLSPPKHLEKPAIRRGTEITPAKRPPTGRAGGPANGKAPGSGNPPTEADAERAANQAPGKAKFIKEHEKTGTGKMPDDGNETEESDSAPEDGRGPRKGTAEALPAAEETPDEDETRAAKPPAEPEKRPLRRGDLERMPYKKLREAAMANKNDERLKALAWRESRMDVAQFVGLKTETQLKRLLYSWIPDEGPKGKEE